MWYNTLSGEHVLEVMTVSSMKKAMATFPETIRSQQHVLDQIVQRIAEVTCPQRIVLFGSAARGQTGPDSDLDLLVIVRGPVHRRALAQEITRNLHGIPLPVDIVVATEQDVQRYGDKVGTVLRPALREGQVIYDREA